jgi:hypothetical protein
VPRRAQNVILFYPQRRASEDLPVPLERLSAAVQELDELSRWVEHIVRDPNSSAQEWRTACTQLLLRLPGVRQLLAELAEIGVDRCPDAEWAVQVSAARAEAERRLLDLRVSMSSLTRGETGATDAVVSFSFDGPKLAEASAELRRLIVSRYPETLGFI